MEYDSSICLSKDLVSIIDLNAVVLYDIGKKTFIQNYTFTDEKIKQSVIKVDSNNNDIIWLLVTDNRGFIHVINVNKKEKARKIKLHDGEIVNLTVSNKKNLVYTLEKSGLLKVTDFTKGEVKRTLKLENIKNKQKKKQNVLSFDKFDVDESEKNIVFVKNMKIKLFNLDNNSIATIGVHSSSISFLKFSLDGKFIISMTNKDYFIYIWHKKSLNEPLITLQQNTFTNGVQIKQIDRGVYHLFSYNRSSLYGYNIALSELNPDEPLKPCIEVEFSEKNLINVEMMSRDIDNKNSSQSIFVIHGKAFNASNLSTRWLKYSKNSKNFTENMKISSKSADTGENIKKGVNISNNVTVLNEIQMCETFDVNENDTHSSTDVEEYKKITQQSALDTTSISEEKISLLNIIKNSIINNDTATFEWALDQKDLNLIKVTIKKMDLELINLFISKFIEVFQSNVFFKHNLLPWLDLLFKFHMVEIVKLPNKTQNNLRNIQILIQNRTKNLDRLEELSSKLENLTNLFKNRKNQIEKKVQYEPFLVYNESDSEEETKTTIKKKLKEFGIKMTKMTDFKQEKKTQYDEDIDMMEEDDVDLNDIDDAFDIDAEMEIEEDVPVEDNKKEEDIDEMTDEDD